MLYTISSHVTSTQADSNTWKTFTRLPSTIINQIALLLFYFCQISECQVGKEWGGGDSLTPRYLKSTKSEDIYEPKYIT